jgi:hypothetical protein
MWDYEEVIRRPRFNRSDREIELTLRTVRDKGFFAHHMLLDRCAESLANLIRQIRLYSLEVLISRRNVNSVSRSPQFTSPLTPHTTSVPLDSQLVDFRFDVKELNALHRAVDQAGDAIQKSELYYVLVKEEQERRPGQPEETTPQPSPLLRLCSPEGWLNLLLSVVPIKPDARLPIRILVVLLDVTKQRFDVVMDKRVHELARRSPDDDVLMHFHVGHAGILILKAAFETSQAFAEQRQLPETCSAMSQSLPKKIHLQGHIIAIAVRVLNRLSDFVREFWCQNLVGIKKENPVVSQRQRVHRPLALLRPASCIAKLDNLRPVILCKGRAVVATLRIDDINFPDRLQRFQAAREVMRFIADWDNHGHRK